MLISQLRLSVPITLGRTPWTRCRRGPEDLPETREMRGHPGGAAPGVTWGRKRPKGPVGLGVVVAIGPRTLFEITRGLIDSLCPPRGCVGPLMPSRYLRTSTKSPRGPPPLAGYRLRQHGAGPRCGPTRQRPASEDEDAPATPSDERVPRSQVFVSSTPREQGYLRAGNAIG